MPGFNSALVEHLLCACGDAQGSGVLYTLSWALLTLEAGWFPSTPVMTLRSVCGSLLTDQSGD